MPGELLTTKVIIHPLVLLSVVDHYTRMSKIGNQKRVVGVLLGCWRQKGVLDVSNSFAGEFWCFVEDRFILKLNFTQFHSMKMKRISLYGSWITTTWSQCMECLKK